MRLQTSLRLNFIRLMACVTCLMILRATASVSDDPSIKVKAEIARLEQSLGKHPLKVDGMPEIGKDVADYLGQARTAADAGKLYVALENVGRATDLMNGVRAMQEKTAVVSSGLAAFEAEWNKASLELTSLDERSRQRNWSSAPVAVRALSEVAQGRVTPLLEGSRGFATSTKPADGLLYMGEAKGQAEFSTFLYQLNVPRKGDAFVLRSYLSELQRLQQKVNAAFVPPKSIDMHPRFIALNSTLKLGQELDSSRSYAGALYAYLEATRHFGMLDTPVPDAEKQKQLQATVVAKLKALAASRKDESLQQLFLQRAQSYLVHDDGSKPQDDELKAVAVIVDRVLPAYADALKPATPVMRASGKTVNITLVRWPYT